MTEPVTEPTKQKTTAEVLGVAEHTRFGRFYLAVEATFKVEDTVHVIKHDLTTAVLEPNFTLLDLSHIKQTAWSQIHKRLNLPDTVSVGSIVILNAMYLGETSDEEFTTGKRPLEGTTNVQPS